MPEGPSSPPGPPGLPGPLGRPVPWLSGSPLLHRRITSAHGVGPTPAAGAYCPRAPPVTQDDAAGVPVATIFAGQRPPAGPRVTEGRQGWEEGDAIRRCGTSPTASPVSCTAQGPGSPAATPGPSAGLPSERPPSNAPVLPRVPPGPVTRPAGRPAPAARTARRHEGTAFRDGGTVPGFVPVAPRGPGGAAISGGGGKGGGFGSDHIAHPSTVTGVTAYSRPSLSGTRPRSPARRPAVQGRMGDRGSGRKVSGGGRARRIGARACARVRATGQPGQPGCPYGTRGGRRPRARRGARRLRRQWRRRRGAER